MTLEELLMDLRAAGANTNTLQLAMNCYELGLKNGEKSAAQTHKMFCDLAVAAAVRAERERLYKKLAVMPLNDTAHSIAIWIKEQQ